MKNKNCKNVSQDCLVRDFDYGEFKMVELKTWNEKKQILTFHRKMSVEDLIAYFGNQKIALASIYNPTGELTIIINEKE